MLGTHKIEERGLVRTGIVRHIDELGRVVIPIEIRKRFAIAEKDPLEISVEGDRIVLAKPSDACVFCGNDEPLEYHHGRPVCPGCIRELATQLAPTP